MASHINNAMISVVMPVYNGEKYLKEAIESILNQTYRDFEFIILNDGSTDKTEDIILSYNDPRIRYVKNKTNLQIVKALNKGIKLSCGKYIARMDADDISLPNRLEKQVSFLEKHKEIGVLGSSVQTIDAFGIPINTLNFPETHVLIKWFLCFYCPVAHPATMLRRNILDFNPYQERPKHAEDYDLWTRLIWNTKVANLPDVLLQLRKHNKNISVSHLCEQMKNSAVISQQMINRVLDLDNHINLNIIYTLGDSQKKNLREVETAIDVILRLFRKFKDSESLNLNEIREIKINAILKLMNLYKRILHRPYSLKYFIRVFEIDKRLPCTVLFHSLLKRMAKLFHGIINDVCFL
jgi:glycosyltransferase involved in cell wall biosynthesis